MSRARELVGNLAQTNYYLVNIPIKDDLKKHFETSYPDLGNIDVFVKQKLGYLCSEATLPTTSYATAEVKDNYIGITQEFAHTRLYTDMDLTFYVDADYSILRFFEGWMDYISGGNIRDLEPAAGTELGRNIYRRFNFPNYYKVDNMSIMKFERDYDKVLEYTFVNVFPKGVTSIPVSYGAADLLKVTVSFNYDRYVVSRSNITQSIIRQELIEIQQNREDELRRNLPPGTSFLDSGVDEIINSLSPSLRASSSIFTAEQLQERFSNFFGSNGSNVQTFFR